MLKLFNIVLLLVFFINVDCQTISDYNNLGFTFIKGKINNYEKYLPDHSHVIVEIDDWTTAMRRKVSSEIDSNGCFFLKFFILNKQSVLLSYNTGIASPFVQPNDTLNLTFDADIFPLEIMYSGTPAKTSKAVQNYIWYSNSNSKFNIVESFKDKVLHDTTDFEIYKVRKDSILSIELDSLERYFKKNSIDSLDQLWMKENLNIRYLKSFIELYHPKGYSYEGRINEYIKRASYISENLSENEFSNAYEFAGFTNCLHTYISGIGSYLYKQENENLELNSETQNQNKVEKSKEEWANILFPYKIKATEILANQKLKEATIAHIFLQNLEDRGFDLGLDYTLNYINDPLVKASLIKRHTDYKSRISNQQSGLNEIQKDTIINYLKNKYKGNVLYINIWGTWCSACYHSFENTPDLKHRLKGKDIVYIYLCWNCNKVKWEEAKNKKAIKGEHIFLTTEQFIGLNEIFNINSIPRYIIIDRNGRIINENALSPISVEFMQQELVDQIINAL